MALGATRQVTLFITILQLSTFGSAQITVGNGFIDLNFSAEPYFKSHERDSFFRTSLVNLWEVPVTFIDVDGDGFIDAVFPLWEVGTDGYLVAWRRNVEGTGNFEVAPEGAAGTLDEELGERILIDVPVLNFYTNVIAAGDFNADSREDLLVVNGDVQWYAREVAATADGVGNVANFSAEGIPAVFVGNFDPERVDDLPDVTVVDIDLDGGIDVVYNSESHLRYWLHSDDDSGGGGSYPTDGINITSTPVTLPLFIDFDSDGALDVIMVDESYESIVWRPHVASTSSEQPTHTLLNFTVDAAQVYTLEVGDFDNDSDLDLVIWLRTRSVTSLVVFENVDNSFEGNRSLELASYNCCSDCGCIYSVPRIVAVDIDNDGDTDLITYDGLCPDVKLRLNEDPSAGITADSTMFEDASFIWSIDGCPYQNFVNIRTVDFSSRVGLDLVIWSEADDVVSLLRNDLVPTPMPTPMPTNMPTPMPTEIPTHRPTSMPTSMPTRTPTGVPTPAPTPIPIGSCPPLNIESTVPDERVAGTSCDAPRWGDECALRCTAGTTSIGGAASTGSYWCRDDGTWFPDPAEYGLRCSALCPEFPPPSAVTSLRAPCLASQPGRTCRLECATGLIPNVTNPQTLNLASELQCGSDARWHVRGDADGDADAIGGRSPPVTADDVLRCVEPLCRITPGFTVRGIVCVFNQVENVIESTVPYADDYHLEFVVNDTVETHPIFPGLNNFTRNVNESYKLTFRVFMEDPATEHHLEQLYAYNLTLEEEFRLAKAVYAARSLEWMPSVTIDAVPAKFATVRLFEGTSGEPGSMVELPPANPLRPESFAFTVNASTELTLLVTGQSGMQREYVVEVALDNARDCFEQRVCEATGYAECTQHCLEDAGAEATDINVDWRATVGVAAACGVLWLVMTVGLRGVFEHFSWVSPPVITICASIFDGANDVLFIVLLFTEDFATEFAIVVALYLCSICVNAMILVYAIRRELRKYPEFVAWQMNSSAITAFVAFFSLFNCEGFTVLGVGRNLTPKSRGGCGDKKQQTATQQNGAATDRTLGGKMARYFSAPLSNNLELLLQRASWVPLVLDDIGFSVIQLHLIIAGGNRINDTLFVFLALNVCLLVGRLVLVSCRSMTMSSHRSHTRSGTLTSRGGGGGGRSNAVGHLTKNGALAVVPGVELEMVPDRYHEVNSNENVTFVNTDLCATIIDASIRNGDEESEEKTVGASTSDIANGDMSENIKAKKILASESRDGSRPDDEATNTSESGEVAASTESGIGGEGRVDYSEEVAESRSSDSGAKDEVHAGDAKGGDSSATEREHSNASDASDGAHAENAKGGDSSAPERESGNASDTDNGVDSSAANNSANGSGGKIDGNDDDEPSVVRR